MPEVNVALAGELSVLSGLKPTISQLLRRERSIPARLLRFYGKGNVS